jgi:hypothetical protein
LGAENAAAESPLDGVVDPGPASSAAPPPLLEAPVGVPLEPPVEPLLDPLLDAVPTPLLEPLEEPPEEPLLPPLLPLLLPPLLLLLLPPVMAPSCASVPLNSSRSVAPEMPLTVPVSESCQNDHEVHSCGRPGLVTP